MSHSLRSLLTIKNTTLLQTPKQLGLQKLAHGHILRQTLAPTRLEDKVARGGLRSGRFERTETHIAVERVARDDGPAVKDEGDGCLALCVDLQN